MRKLTDEEREQSRIKANEYRRKWIMNKYNTDSEFREKWLERKRNRYSAKKKE